MGQWAEARRWASAAYTIRKDNLRPSDASTLEAQEQLIQILRILGDFNLASQEAQSLKRTLKSLHGRNHSLTLSAYRLVSVTFQDQNLLPPSLAAALKSFNGFKSLYASSELDNRDLLLSTARLASVYTRVGEFDKAEALDFNLIKSFKRRGEEDSVDALKVLFRVSYAQRALGKYNESEQTARECYRRQSIVLGAKHIDALKTYISIGLSLQAQRKFEPSLEVFEEIVDHCLERVGADHVYTFISTAHCAQSLAGVGRLEEAKERFEFAMRGFEGMDPRQDLEVERCREGIATLLRISGSLNEAEEMYELVLKNAKGQKGKEKEILNTACWEGLTEIWKSRASEMHGKETKTCLKKAVKFAQQAL
ncbi:hypothetical protein EG329_012112 [Mollisiaceae sp. DMI_Dod_QoI]|nr:hypothetical protein EG329_012112 [Helotiales sp. DMI_Dod_QoI]